MRKFNLHDFTSRNVSISISTKRDFRWQLLTPHALDITAIEIIYRRDDI